MKVNTNPDKISPQSLSLLITQGVYRGGNPPVVHPVQSQDLVCLLRRTLACSFGCSWAMQALVNVRTGCISQSHAWVSCMSRRFETTAWVVSMVFLAWWSVVLGRSNDHAFKDSLSVVMTWSNSTWDFFEFRQTLILLTNIKHSRFPWLW